MTVAVTSVTVAVTSVTVAVTSMTVTVVFMGMTVVIVGVSFLRRQVDDFVLHYLVLFVNLVLVSSPKIC